jgi:hypothetical protein
VKADPSIIKDGETRLFSEGPGPFESEMRSIESNVDLELIAAFIDGRLTGEDRARAMKLLADSDEALEIYALALRERQEMPDFGVVPIATRRRWRQWKVVVPIVAAAGLAIVAVPTLHNRGASAPLAREYAMELGRDPRFVNGLPNGWEQRRWAEIRGANSNQEASGARRPSSGANSSLAFRLGVRSVDLQVALQRGDTALGRRLIDEILETLNSVALSATVATRYATLRSRLASDTRSQAIDRASDAERRLRERLASASFEFGQWLGAAELAARTHDASFFQSARGTQFIQSTDSLSADDRKVLRSIDARLKQAPIDRALDDVDEILQKAIQRRGGSVSISRGAPVDALTRALELGRIASATVTSPV